MVSQSVSLRNRHSYFSTIELRTTHGQLENDDKNNSSKSLRPTDRMEEKYGTVSYNGASVCISNRGQHQQHRQHSIVGSNSKKHQW